MPDSPVPNSIDDFQNRFDALVLEAKGYGIESIVILLDSEHLTLETIMRTSRASNHFAAIGALESYKHTLLGQRPV